MQTGKHIIFLGAGASKASGYPLANELRLLISSRKEWEKALKGYGKISGDSALVESGLKYWDLHASTLDLFRNGGFGTLDEFCKLAGPQFQEEINGLRCLVRAALGLFNPEDHFEKSEYYSFVQSLFKEDLFSLREDVAVLTYNYDPYLEFLIYRALEHRRRIRRRGGSPFLVGEDVAELMEHEKLLNTVTSGFLSVENLSWLGAEKAPPTFAVLKLHGSICQVMDEIASFETLFSNDAAKRARNLFEGKAISVPPILFPWETVTGKDFVGTGRNPYYPLFRGVWERARREVQAADKISFVGLSMHPFLADGLKYLFEGKQGPTEIVVANPDNAAFIGKTGESHWCRQFHTSAYAASQFLSSVAPSMKRVGKPPGHGMARDGEITLVEDFEEFITTQMKPVQP